MIRYLKGDATRPQTDDPTVIAHIVNDVGKWGAGFVLALTKRWPQPEVQYRKWYYRDIDEPFELGRVQFVPVQSDLFEPQMWVANMVAQHGVRGPNNPKPIDYDALDRALEALAVFAKEREAAVAMPRLGCGLAGGRWDKVVLLVSKHLVDNGIETLVYDLDDEG